MKKYIVNDKIRAREVRLIDGDGGQLGIVKIEYARQLADEKGLDILVVSEEASPPVCKLVNFGQFRYEQQKKEKLAKKTGKGHVIKELKISPKISIHDFQVRVVNGRKFLEKGYKIKVSLFFKGREAQHPELGREMMNRFIDDVKDIAVLDGHLITAPKSMIAILNPKS